MAGRPKRSTIDVMRTRLWLAEMLRVTGTENLNQLGDLLEDVDAKKMLYRYAKGVDVVSGKMLAEVEARVGQCGLHYANVRRTQCGRRRLSQQTASSTGPQSPLAQPSHRCREIKSYIDACSLRATA
ncbi:hypothetical protein [Pseudomonas sp.]|uniref:hypothetical protein n=1 Tax=Pseudomonas sp. TaxID=306 RepID=UPI00260D36B9|nr:hypothetical protein [Pseudomonas sp.]